MGKTLLELFKSKKLDTGTTAADKYDVRNSKSIPVSSASGILSPSFGALNKLRKSGLSLRTRETFIEEETTGLRPLRTLSAPQIYGTELIRITRRSTNMLDDMKNGANGGSADNGIIGNALNKLKVTGLNLASKIGIKFPQEVIPTRLSINPDFLASKEPDIPQTLQKIKGDSAGNFVGKFLAQNVKGSPKQIANAALGNAIQAGKDEVRKILFGGRKSGQQLYASKNPNGVSYDSSAPYSSTVDADAEIGTRNDLSSILNKTGGDPQNLKLINTNTQDKKSKLLLGNQASGVNPKNTSKDLLKNVAANGGPLPSGKDILPPTFGQPVNLAAGRKVGQQLLADKVEKSKGVNDILKYDPSVPESAYSNTVDEADSDVQNRNDLSTLLERRQLKAGSTQKGNQLNIVGIGNSGIPARAQKQRYSKENLTKSMETIFNMDSVSNELNKKGHYIEKGKGDIDALDFITVKFTSIPTGKSVNFVATITGITEDVSSTWDSAKFLGSPFDYYTYNGISRGVNFNLRLFSLNAQEHVAMWERINTLTSFLYPAGYGGQTYVVPPFLKLTIGDLYVKKECFIESLSYTVDDTAGWETGNNYSWFNINGTTAVEKDGITPTTDKKLKNYKLPLVVDVSINVKFVETRTNAVSNFYGFKSILPNTPGKEIEEKTNTQPRVKISNPVNDITNRYAINTLAAKQIQKANTSNLAFTPGNNPIERALNANAVPKDNVQNLSPAFGNAFTIPKISVGNPFTIPKITIPSKSVTSMLGGANN